MQITLLGHRTKKQNGDTEMTEVKEINFKDLQNACKSLHTILDDKTKFKYVGVKKDDVIKSFTETVVKVAEKDADSLPDNVVDFFNLNGGEEDDKKSKKGKKGKKGKKAKEAKTEKPTKEEKKKPAKPAKKEAKKEAKSDAVAKPKPAKKKAPEKKKDEFGFTVGTKYSKVAALLSKKPMKMADLKAKFDDTYYNLFNNNEKIFGNKHGYFYVKGKVKVADIPKPEKKEKKATKKTSKKASKKK